MKKKEIIKRLKTENSKNVSFDYNFKQIKSKVNFPTQAIYTKPPRNIFKYLSGALSVFVVALTFLLVFNFYQQNNNSLTSPNDRVETSDVYNQFEDLDAVYLKDPVKTYIINDEIIKMYLGLLADDQIVLIFSYDDGSNNQLTIRQSINNDDYIIDFDQESVNETSDDFVDVPAFNNSLIIESNKSDSIYINLLLQEFEIVDIEEFIEYLKNNRPTE